MLIIGKSILLIINNTRSIQNPKLLFFILIIHHVLKRTCFLINSQKRTAKSDSPFFNEKNQQDDKSYLPTKPAWWFSITLSITQNYNKAST